MEINKSNYFAVIKEIGIENLTENLKKGYEFINRITRNGSDWKDYNKFQKPIDLQFSALGLWMDKVYNKKGKHSQPERSSGERKKPVQESKNKTGKSSKVESKKKHHPVKKFEKPKVKGKDVELISPEVAFIKRFALLHGKTKTKDQIVSFIKALQKAIIERRIRKTSRHRKVIEEIQHQLIQVHKKMGSQIELRFDDKDLYRYYKLAGAEVMMPSVRFIKAYYNLQGKEITKEKANNLLQRIEKAFEKKELSSKDKYYKHIRLITNSLSEYLKGSKNSLHISEAQLNGLECVLKDCGCNTLKGLEEDETENNEEKDDGVMSVQEARNIKFRPVELTGEWLKLIGKMCLPTHFLVYGHGGSGKTSFVLLFTQYLAKMGYKILYIAREQYNTPTFTDLLNRLNIEVGENFKIVKDLDVLNPSDFDFVVLDSKDDMDIQLKQFKTIKEQYPSQSFIAISQGTKTGDFTGKGQWRNAIDVMIHAEDGIIKTGEDKNRWGGSGEFKVI